MKQLTDVQAYQQEPLPKRPGGPRYKYDGASWVMIESGAKYVLTRDEAIERMGYDNAMIAADVPNLWIALDNDPRAETSVPEMLPFGDVSRPSTSDLMQLAALLPVAVAIHAMTKGRVAR